LHADKDKMTNQSTNLSETSTLSIDTKQKARVDDDRSVCLQNFCLAWTTGGICRCRIVEKIKTKYGIVV
jgi:hypothetical protein